MYDKYGVCLFLGMGKTFNELEPSLLLGTELLVQEITVQEWFVSY